MHKESFHYSQSDWLRFDEDDARLAENSNPGIYQWNLPVFPCMANKAQVANTGK